ncbi:hypothetical protein K501DRAFT_279182 [Backusella circina FSU 941]|nr:hypothetical protein K501DRAFT_279182 [Backusella circina FSU 941]
MSRTVSLTRRGPTVHPNLHTGTSVYIWTGTMSCASGRRIHGCPKVESRSGGGGTTATSATSTTSTTRTATSTRTAASITGGGTTETSISEKRESFATESNNLRSASTNLKRTSSADAERSFIGRGYRSRGGSFRGGYRCGTTKNTNLQYAKFTGSTYIETGAHPAGTVNPKTLNPFGCRRLTSTWSGRPRKNHSFYHFYGEFEALGSTTSLRALASP